MSDSYHSSHVTPRGLLVIHYWMGIYSIKSCTTSVENSANPNIAYKISIPCAFNNGVCLIPSHKFHKVLNLKD